MTKEELVKVLRSCAKDIDTERGHVDADAALLAFISDPEITAAYEAIPKWYA